MAGGSGSAGSAEQGRAQGRHRRSGGGAGWTPVLTADPVDGARHAKPMSAPPVPPSDRLVDTGPMGLRTFDLGHIPASVTPPATWRRAAWFAIFASAAALVGLLFVTAVLVGPVHVADDINSLPGLPAYLPGFTPSVSSGAPTQPPGPRRRRGDVSQTARVAGPTSAAGTGPVNGFTGPTGQLPLPPGTGSVGGPLPPVTTVSGGAPVANPAQLGQLTQTYFSEVTTNVNAAAGMTADTVRGDAAAIIAQDYGNISTIQIKSISLDPSNGLTVSMLRVVGKDGTVSTEQRTLQFTLNGDPKIENPGG